MENTKHYQKIIECLMGERLEVYKTFASRPKGKKERQKQIRNNLSFLQCIHLFNNPTCQAYFAYQILEIIFSLELLSLQPLTE